ncbi:jg14339 [Pararge aegeria aegeria]|uniref:Jg14339 protein n=1 Tax=Pararge aegeria aegeria TaxID=348720 RepID=A0A8S4R5E1_9NEOP|nr:jg14339 [Pararge aegeria aegeria]
MSQIPCLPHSYKCPELFIFHFKETAAAAVVVVEENAANPTGQRIDVETDKNFKKAINPLSSDDSRVLRSHCQKRWRQSSKDSGHWQSERKYTSRR